MRSALWLAVQEVIGRRLGSVMAAGMIALTIAFIAGLELLARAREAAVSAEIDWIGPALRLIPHGKTARDLARFDLVSAPFKTEDVQRLRSELKPRVANIEGRLLLKVPLGNRLIPVVGIVPDAVVSPFAELRALDADSIVIGAEAAADLGVSKGAELRLQGRSYTVGGILPQTANPEDSAIFMHVKRLQAMFGLSGALNELRVFPAPGADIDDLSVRLAARHPEMSVLDTHRGETAEHSINATLRENRNVLYLITGLIIAASVLIWSYINSNERKVEMATVAAVGATAWTVLSMVVARGALLGFAGALVGFAAGIVIALAQDFGSAIRVLPSLDLGLAVIGFATVLSAVGAAPVAAVVGFQDPVTVLQET
jgi:hypothetical protein